MISAAETNAPAGLPAGAVAWWPGNGNTADILGGNNSQLLGGTGYGAGKVGEGFVFSGSTPRVFIPAAPVLNVGTNGGMTIELWMNPATLAPNVPLVEWNNGTWWGAHFHMQNSRLYANLVDVNGYWHQVFSDPIIPTGVFQHAALTYDRESGHARIYLNGTQIGDTYVGNITLETSWNLYLGHRPAGDITVSFDGVLDEVTIYKRALSATELQSIVQAGPAGKTTTVVITPPHIVTQPQSKTVWPGDPVSFSVLANGTIPLKYRWRFADSELPGATNSTLNIASAQSNNVGGYSVVVSNAAGMVTSAVATLTLNNVPATGIPVPAGLVAWWPGDGNAEDLLGMNHGQANGVGYAPGRVSDAFAFSASNSAVEIPASSSLDVGTGAGFSIELWMNPTELAPNVPLVEWNNGTWWGAHFHMQEHRLYANLVDKAGAWHQVFSTQTVATAVFQHAALTFDAASGQARLFLNGKVVGSGYVGSFTPETSWDLYLGRRVAGAGALTYLGLLDEVSLYNRALTGDEVSAIYHAGPAGKDKTFTPAAPQITHQPQNRDAWAGENAQFTVTASGTGPLGYHWFFQGNLISEATASTLTISSVQTSNAGSYFVVVSNVAGSVTSAVATLTVNSTPNTGVPVPAGLVAWWPGDGNTDDIAGNNPALVEGAVNYTSGKVAQGFQLTEVPDALFIPASSTLDVGNGGGLTLELWVSPTVVTGNVPLVEWNNGTWWGAHFHIVNGRLYANLVDTFGYWHQVFSSSGNLETGLFQHVALTYNRAEGRSRMFLNGNIVADVQVGNIELQTGWNLYLGRRPAGDISVSYRGVLDEVSLYNRPLTAEQIQGIFRAGPAGKSKVVVVTPPAFVSQPQSQSAWPGETVQLSASATGSSPLQFQWWHNGEAVGGANAPSLVINNVQAGDGGNYFVVVGNAAGSITSHVATVTINTTSPVCIPSPTGLVAWLSGDGNAADLAGANHGMLQGDANFAPGMVGEAFHFNGEGSFVSVADSPSLHLTAGLSIELWARADTTNWGALLERSAGPSGCNYGMTASASRGLQLYFNDPNVSDGDDSGSINEVSAYQPLPSSGTFHHLAGTFRQAGTNNVELKTYVDGLLIRTRLLQGNLVRAAKDGPVTIGARRGQTNFFRGLIDEVSIYDRPLDDAEIQGLFNARVAGKCKDAIAPRIAAQPIDVSAHAGDLVAFQVIAAGTSPLQYQWTHNGTPIEGATSDRLTIDSMRADLAGAYVVTVSNSFGYAISAPAQLTFDTTPRPVLPTIITQPTNVTVMAGDTAFFTVVVEGTAPLKYQWHFNSSPLAGATQASLMVSNAGPASTGAYFVLVSNAAGVTASAVANLVVLPNTRPPSITRQPISRTVLPGSTISFSVEATGGSPLSYQWRYNDSDIPGATSPLLTLQNVQAAAQGLYSVLVINPFGNAPSDAAQLVVTNPPVWGTVNFANRYGDVLNAPIFDTDGTNLLNGTAYRAALLAGPTAATMVEVGPAARFFVPGYFSGGSRAVPNVRGGETAYVQVRVWSLEDGTNYTQAVANGGKVGLSSIIAIATNPSTTPPAPPAQPAVLAGLQSFSLTQGLGAAMALVTITMDARLDDGRVQWLLRGQSGARYAVEYSSNLTEWNAISIVVPVDGEARFVDESRDGNAYYRARLMQ